MVRPEHFGDHYEWAKLSILRGLIKEEWAYHPMYFTHKPSKSFPCEYASFLGVRLVGGDIWKRRKLVDILQDCPGQVFLDPDKGLWWKSLDEDRQKHLRISIDDELVPIASSAGRRNKLSPWSMINAPTTIVKSTAPREHKSRRSWIVYSKKKFMVQRMSPPCSLSFGSRRTLTS